MKTRIVPSLRYQDCRQAIDWLCATFGFEEQLVVPNENGGIAHARLVCGTASVYMIVEDVDNHYEKARAAGAEIVLDIVDEHGGRGYTCKDLEGHLWSFGSADPWE